MKTIKQGFIIIFFVVFSGCTWQDKKDLEIALITHEKTAQNDSLSMPRVDIKVNKKLDNNGNITSYDSTCFYFYLNPQGMMKSSNDSVYKHFRSFFEESYSGLMNRDMKNIFFTDTLFKHDFFNDNYFQKQFQINERMFDNMYKQIDSIQRNFFKVSSERIIKKNKIK